MASSLLFCVCCSGAFEDVRTDRTIAVFKSTKGPKLVLVSDAALKDADPERFRGNWNRSDFTHSELSDAMTRFLFGGRCKISGAVIPPITPEEAVKLREEAAESFRESLEETMPEANEGEIRQAALARLDAWIPDLARIAALAVEE